MYNHVGSITKGMNDTMKKIDIFSHILTPEYVKKYLTIAPEVSKTFEFGRPAMTDLTTREKLMLRNPDVLQIVTMGNVPLERYVSAQNAIELSKVGNEEMAELVKTKPNLFYGAVGTIPVDDVDASLKIIEHCVNDLGLLGIQLFTTLERESFTEPKYRPVFALMAELDRPIWVHPAATKFGPSRGAFLWPYESSCFMFDIVKAGIFADHPDLKIIIHHAGAMIPYFWERVRITMPKHSEKYLKYFYTDTALYGNTPGLMCAYDYFGADHILYGTDAPLGCGPLVGYGNTQRTITAIEKMDITDEDKEKIFYGNAVQMFVSPI